MYFHLLQYYTLPFQERNIDTFVRKFQSSILNGNKWKSIPYKNSELTTLPVQHKKRGTTTNGRLHPPQADNMPSELGRQGGLWSGAIVSQDLLSE